MVTSLRVMLDVVPFIIHNFYQELRKGKQCWYAKGAQKWILFCQKWYIKRQGVAMSLPVQGSN